jgi:hypothetical protein
MAGKKPATAKFKNSQCKHFKENTMSDHSLKYAVITLLLFIAE